MDGRGWARRSPGLRLPSLRSILGGRLDARPARRGSPRRPWRSDPPKSTSVRPAHSLAHPLPSTYSSLSLSKHAFRAHRCAHRAFLSRKLTIRAVGAGKSWQEALRPWMARSALGKRSRHGWRIGGSCQDLPAPTAKGHTEPKKQKKGATRERVPGRAERVPDSGCGDDLG